MPQVVKGSVTRMVSSRSGLVESMATGQPISSSMRRTYLIACAGSSAHERAPAVVSDQPSMRLVDRRHPGLERGRRRQVVEALAVELVADADLQLLEAVEHVELGQRDAVDAARRAGLAHQRRVEPAAAALAPGDGAELVAALAEALADRVVELGRERARSRRGWCRP